MILCVKVQNVCVEQIAEAESRQHGGCDAAANDARLMGTLFTDFLPHKDRDAHGDFRDHRHDALNDLAAFREIICLFHSIFHLKFPVI